MSKSNIPSVPPARNVSNVLGEIKALEQAIVHLDGSVEQVLNQVDGLAKKIGVVWDCRWSGGGYRFPFYDVPSDFDLAGARQESAQIQQSANLLPQVIRPAVADEIATQLTLLLGAYPSQKGERQLFSQQLCEGVAERKPSVYALHLACRKLRQESNFVPTIAEVLRELKLAERRAHRLHDLASRLSGLQELLDSYEKDLARLRKEHAERRKQRVEELRRGFEEYPYHNYGREDRQLLGLSYHDQIDIADGEKSLPWISKQPLDSRYFEKLKSAPVSNAPTIKP
jgi:hypothetical protein